MANKNNAQEGLALSADAKPRLKWTRELHEQFVDAVAQLGGADKATPKSVMRVMRIPGLTLYHLKSHLQKYRPAKSQDSIASNKKQDMAAVDCRLGENKSARACDNISRPQINENMLQIQLEVQRELQERIEVQKHLQLRIEAQGKYLQSVLRKAQETIAMYGAKAGLSELASAVEHDRHADSSTDSCLTSLCRAGTTSVKQCRNDTSDCSYTLSADSDEIGPSESARQTGRCSWVREEIDLNK